MKEGEGLFPMETFEHGLVLGLLPHLFCLSRPEIPHLSCVKSAFPFTEIRQRLSEKPGLGSAV